MVPEAVAFGGSFKVCAVCRFVDDDDDKFA